MKSSEYYKVPTIRVRRHRRVAWEMRGESWQYGHTLIRIKWPTYSVLSKWYLMGENNQKIYLKSGWNMFGKDSTSFIQFKDVTLSNPCSLSIGIPDNGSVPMVHNIGSYCFFNGQYMSIPHKLKDKSTVTLLSGGTAIILKFGKDRD